MVKYFCDICGAEMSRQDQGRIRVRRGRVSVEIMTALDNTWNNGQICHSCIVDVVFAYGEHSRDVYKLEDDHVLTFFPADPNVEVLEAVKRRNLELLTRAEAAERQIVANEARITELTRLKDELAEDASRERQRAEAAELSLKLIEADNRDLIEAHRRIGELERALADEREGHAIDNDEGAEIIINLMGDVQLLTEQLAAAIKRAEAAEAAIAAVPRQAIDALFRQQFGSYPVWFNEMWTPIADWLGYKPARR